MHGYKFDPLLYGMSYFKILEADKGMLNVQHMENSIICFKKININYNRIFWGEMINEKI